MYLTVGRAAFSPVPVLSLEPGLWVCGQTSAPPPAISFPVCAVSKVSKGTVKCKWLPHGNASYIVLFSNW